MSIPSRSVRARLRTGFAAEDLPLEVGRLEIDVRTVEMRGVRFYPLEGVERSSALIRLGAKPVMSMARPTPM